MDEQKEKRPLDDARIARIGAGYYVSERLPSGAVRANEGTPLAAASAVAEGVVGTGRSASTGEFANAVTRGEREKARLAAANTLKVQEASALGNWAERNGWMLDDGAFEKEWARQGSQGGAEHNVYRDTDANGRWFKRNNLSFHGDYVDYFHRMQLHNWLFMEAPVRFEGFVKHDGALLPVISQQNINAARGATLEEVKVEAGRMDLAHAGGEDFVHPKTGIQVGDLHDENVFKTPEGSTAIIDPSISFDPTTKWARLKSELAAAKIP